MRLTAWLRRIVRRLSANADRVPDRLRSGGAFMSQRWLEEHDQDAMKTHGWEGPRWRSPTEIVEQQRAERRRRIALFRSERDEDRRRA